VTVDRAKRTIDRAAWGWTPALDAELRALGWEAWLESQLAPESIDDDEMAALLEGYSTLDASVAELADLLLADARSPAMLVYLDQWLSSSTSDEGVDVNFARDRVDGRRRHQHR